MPTGAVCRSVTLSAGEGLLSRSGSYTVPDEAHDPIKIGVLGTKQKHITTLYYIYLIGFKFI